MKSVCVFCGSRNGVRPEYLAAAEQLGKVFAQQGLQLVFGGGGVGLMGAVSDACLANGVPVVGVQPRFLIDREVMRPDLTEAVVVETMHERKRIMYERSDAFVILPGGIGTLDELFEIYTWAQLGLHPKPIGIWNVAGYWTKLLDLLDAMEMEGFLSTNSRNLVLVDTDLSALVERLRAHQVPVQEDWLTPSKTG